jgi:hypothetical protein
MGVRSDRLEWSFSMCGAWFVLLAHRATLYIFFCEILHFLPLIGLTEKVYGVHDTGMSHKGVVIVTTFPFSLP